MKNKFRKLVAGVLLAGMVLGSVPAGSVYGAETDPESIPQLSENLGNVAEDAGTAEDSDAAVQETDENAGTAVQDAAENAGSAEAGEGLTEWDSGEAGSITVGEINFVYIESPYLETPDTQRIVAAFDQEVSGAETIALLVADEDGNEEEWPLAKQAGSLYLFEKEYAETDSTGTYHAVSIILRNQSGDKTLVLSELDVDAQFGVNEAYEGLEELRPVEGVTEEEKAEVEASVVTIDENGVAEAQDSITDALDTVTLNAAGAAGAAAKAGSERSGNIVVALDPGHDANDAGAQGFGLKEEVLTLKIANYCKEELEQYAGVSVFMTRTGLACPYNCTSAGECIEKRAQAAAEAGAKIFVSFHLNASTASSANGAEIIVPNYNWKYEVGAEGHALAEEILAELTALGLQNRGIYSKDTTINETYPDGSLSDYFSVMIYNKENDIPGIIVEHAFITNSGDVNSFLTTEAGLKKLGVADATGIANYLGLGKGAWETDSNGNKYFYENGQRVTGEKKIGDSWYYFDPAKDGAMTTGWYQHSDGRKVYYNANGAMLFGEHYIEGRWRYFNPSNGNLWTGWCNLSGKKVYYDAEGGMVFGEQAIDGKWYYFSTKDGAMVTGFYNLDGKRVYYGTDGAMVFGERAINGKWYYFSTKDGAMVTGFYDLDGKRVYYGTDGAMVFGERAINGKWYYFSTKNGGMTTGWHEFPNKKVYYNSDGVMLFGEQKIEGEWYYLSTSDGAMRTGWQTISGKVKYYRSNGKRVSGEYSIGGKWYYFKEDDGSMVTGWYDLPGKRVYYNADGQMVFGEYAVDGKWYYFSTKDGSMVTGWYDLPGKRVYYHESEGYMLFGSQIIDGKRYYLNPSNGAMCTNITVDGYYYGSDGAAVNALTSYQIEGEAAVTADEMVSYYETYSPIEYPGEELAKGGAGSLLEFAEIFYEEACKEGIRPEVVWAQTMLETNFLQFGNQVKIEQFNFAGLGATDNGAAGADFSEYGEEGVRMGVRAQVQHMKAYSSPDITKDTLKEECVDPRFDLVNPKGSAQHVEHLGQKENPTGQGWATASGYGYRILALMEKLLKIN